MKHFILTSLALAGLTACNAAHAAPTAPDLLRYNITIDATACGNTEDVTGADEYYVAGVFTAVLPDGSARSYSAVTYPFATNDNQQFHYQTVMLDDMLPRGTRIYGQMRFYDEDFAKDWNAVAGKFNSAADAGVKAATATGNPTATVVAGAAYAAFKVFDAVSSSDSDDLLGQVGISMGDNTLAPGGVTKILIKDGAMNYDYNHPARAVIKAQADQAFTNKSLVNYYSGDIRFSKSDITGWSSWAYTQSWLTFIEDPNLNPKTGQPIVALNSTAWIQKMVENNKAEEKKRAQKKVRMLTPARVATTLVGKSPFTYKGDFTKKTTGLDPRIKLKDVGGIGGVTGRNPGKLPDKIPGGLGEAQNLPDDDGATTPGISDETPGGVETGDQGGGAAATADEKLVAASATPMEGEVGQTFGVILDSKETQDFNLDLPAGQFFVFVDAQRVDEGSLTSNSDLFLRLLKRNGVEMPQYTGDLIYHNTRERSTRVGKAFAFAKPTGVRFRLKNDSDGINNFWLTVVAAPVTKFLPFNFPFEMVTGKIGPNNGAGGLLEERNSFNYLRATIPAGKWSVSLGAKGQDNGVYVSLFSLNANGIDYPGSISINGVDNGARKEEIITLAKPTTLLFRISNDGSPANYDVTIEPSTD